MRRVTASLESLVAAARAEAVSDRTKPGNLTEMIFDPPPIFAPPPPEPERRQRPIWRAIAAKFRRPPPAPAGLPDARVARVALRNGVE